MNINSSRKLEPSNGNNNDKESQFLGKDIVDKIFNCPTRMISSFENWECERIGLILIGIRINNEDYLRMEKDYQNQKEENLKLNNEKEKLNGKIKKIQLKEGKKFDLVNNYYNEIKMRFEFNQKLFSEKLNFDNSLILEVRFI
jgi:hypothetical protein